MYDPLPEPLASVAARAGVPGAALHLHGPTHWKCVALTGHALVRRDSRIDPLVVWLFAQLHDSQRNNDQHDAQHGPRAAQVTRALIGSGSLRGVQPGSARAQKLIRAINDHTAGKTDADVTVGACWDADRLNLWRVGTTPAVRFMSTPAARRDFARLSAYARKLVNSQPPAWAEVERCVS
jgi:uncharacterized protein